MLQRGKDAVTDRLRTVNNFTVTQWGEGMFVVILGIALSISMLTNSKPLDSVPIYMFTHAIPDKDALNNALSNNPSGTSTALAATARAAIDPQCKVTYRSSQSSNQLITDSPACECLYAVLNKYATLTASTDTNSNAQRAFTACFKTQHLIPKNKDAFNTTNPDWDSNSRKLISRSGALFMLCLSIVFHLVYNSIQYSDANAYSSSNWMQRLALLLCVVMQWLLPLSSSITNTQSSKLTLFYLMLILPAFLEFCFIDYFWSYIYNYKRKTSFIHPYVFQTTFLALMTIAMVENGVFDYDIIFTHYLTAHTLTFAYAAVLFFQHYGCNKQDSDTQPVERDPRIIDWTTMSGYILLGAASAGIIVHSVLPCYPVSSTLDPTWLLPWLFAGSAFLIPIFVEHMLDGGDGDIKLDWLAHIGFRVYLGIVVFALLFYTMRQWHLMYGKSIPTSMGLPSDTMNFGLKSRNSDSTLFILL